MEELRFQGKQLPEQLWRVQYPRSQTRYNREGLVAKDTTTLYASKELFGQAVEKHFTWGCRDRSSFISFFRDRDDAVKWGRGMHWLGKDPNRKGEWSLITVDTSELEDIYVFRVRELWDQLDLNLPQGAKWNISGGYVCLHRIPARAIEIVQRGEDAKLCELSVPALLLLPIADVLQPLRKYPPSNTTWHPMS